jgi:hypothetical protein
MSGDPRPDRNADSVQLTNGQPIRLSSRSVFYGDLVIFPGSIDSDVSFILIDPVARLAGPVCFGVAFLIWKRSRSEDNFLRILDAPRCSVRSLPVRQTRPIKTHELEEELCKRTSPRSSTAR